MKTNLSSIHLLPRALCAEFLRSTLFTLPLLAFPVSAQNWQTVDNFQYVGGGSSNDAWANGMTKDPSGSIYALGAGVVDESNFYYHAVIRKSADSGANWSVIDDFSNGDASPNYEYTGIAANATGNLFATGEGNLPWFVSRSVDSGANWLTVDAVTPALAFAVATDPAGNIYVAGGGDGSPWTVRKSTDGGNSWSTVDSFNPGGGSVARGVLCHPSAGLFVTGYGNAVTMIKGKQTIQQFWYVRRSLDGGATWSTVDAYAGGQAKGIGADASGNIYALGANGNHWIVRKSTNGGVSWATVDDFYSCITSSTKPVTTKCFAGFAEAFASDSRGNLFVVGSTKDPVTFAYTWVVRESLNGSGIWQTVDTFQYTFGKSAQASAAVADNFGNVFVAGYGTGTDGYNHWLVRKLAAP